MIKGLLVIYSDYALADQRQQTFCSSRDVGVEADVQSVGNGACPGSSHPRSRPSVAARAREKKTHIESSSNGKRSIDGNGQLPSIGRKVYIRAILTTIRAAYLYGPKAVVVQPMSSHGYHRTKLPLDSGFVIGGQRPGLRCLNA